VSDTKLKECPFCGTNKGVSAHHNGLDLWSVRCGDCGVEMEEWGGGYHERYEAVEAWNTRKPKAKQK